MPAALHQDSTTEMDRDEDDIFRQLEQEEDNDEFMASARERRFAQLKFEMEQLKEMKSREHGTYTELRDDKSVMEATTQAQLCVVHFYHKEFRRCQIMDKHLIALSRKHFKTRFIKAEVENVPFLVHKLQVKTLPCIISFINGVSVDRLVGFEELGNTDNFTTSALERRLTKIGMVKLAAEDSKQSSARKSIFGQTARGSESEDSDD